MKKKEPMDIYFAVFNCHINDAERKAIRRFKRKYGSDIFNAEIKPFLDNGIMSIFNTDPTPYTQYFAETIQSIVNQ